MRRAEELLEELHQEYDTVDIPEDLEEKLRGALSTTTKVPLKSKRWLSGVVALSIATLVIGTNFSTFAYYGKRLIGYDTIMNGQLQTLNNLGKGQAINKPHTFSTGVTVTLDGIMLDDTQLLAFYTIYSPHEKIDELHIREGLKGTFKTYRQEGGQGEFNESRQEVKWVMSFEPPAFYEKNLIFKVELFKGSVVESGEIAFTLDREKAMGNVLKQRINQTVKVEDTHLTIDTLVAAPTRCVINGTIEDSFDLLKRQLGYKHYHPIEVQLILKANGEALNEQGGGMSINSQGIRFTREFDALPEPLTSLELMVTRLTIDKETEASLNLEEGNVPWEMMIEGQKVILNEVQEKEGYTLLTLTTQDNVLLSKVYLEIDGKKIELEGTDEGALTKTEEGVFHTRTLRFPATGHRLRFVVERILYPENGQQVITLPIK